MLQSLLGCAEPRFKSLELLRLCADGLLPCAREQEVAKDAQMVTYFWWTVLSSVSRSPSSLNRLSSSDMKFSAMVLQAMVRTWAERALCLAPGELTIEGVCWVSSRGQRLP